MDEISAHWHAYFIALVIGLLIGIERERAHPNEKIMGVRTFILISLLGAIAGGMQNSWIVVLLLAFSLGLILISYFNQTNSKARGIDPGLTTEFAAAIVLCLSYVAHQAPSLSATLGPVVALILYSKSSLHHFTYSIKRSELEAALLLILGGVVITQLIPDHIVDPWGIFNPRRFGYIILMLASLEFSSYIIAKIVGEKKGTIVSGFLGGLVSSTAVLLTSARIASKNVAAWKPMLVSSLAAKLAALIELLVIVGLISPPLLAKILLPIGAGAIICALTLYILNRKMEPHEAKTSPEFPLDWRGVFHLAILLSAILATVSVTKHWLGDSATLSLSFFTGLFELHGVSIATATMFSHGQLTETAAALNISFAAIASLIFKMTISWVIKRNKFAVALTFSFLPMLVAIALVTWLTHLK